MAKWHHFGVFKLLLTWVISNHEKSVCEINLPVKERRIESGIEYINLKSSFSTVKFYFISKSKFAADSFHWPWEQCHLGVPRVFYLIQKLPTHWRKNIKFSPCWIWFQFTHKINFEWKLIVYVLKGLIENSVIIDKVSPLYM